MIGATVTMMMAMIMVVLMVVLTVAVVMVAASVIVVGMSGWFRVVVPLVLVIVRWFSSAPRASLLIKICV